MPKLEFPRITKPIQLSDYAQEFCEAKIDVWVNTPREIISQLRSFREMEDAEVFAWLSRVWGEAWPVNEVEAIWTYSNEKDPAFWNWLVEQTVTHLMDYRAGIKKA